MSSMISGASRAIAGVSAMLLVGFATPSDASTVRLGTLACEVEGGGAFIVGSNKGLFCIYERTDGVVENYNGRLKTIGLDIGVTSAEAIVWTVLSATDSFAPGELAGRYVGVSADASLGVGAGANVLVGGSADSISLQPLSLQTQRGINIAIGGSELTLALESVE